MLHAHPSVCADNFYRPAWPPISPPPLSPGYHYSYHQQQPGRPPPPPPQPGLPPGPPPGPPPGGPPPLPAAVRPPPPGFPPPLRRPPPPPPPAFKSHHPPPPLTNPPPPPPPLTNPPPPPPPPPPNPESSRACEPETTAHAQTKTADQSDHRWSDVTSHDVSTRRILSPTTQRDPPHAQTVKLSSTSKEEERKFEPVGSKIKMSFGGRGTGGGSVLGKRPAATGAITMKLKPQVARIILCIAPAARRFI